MTTLATYAVCVTGVVLILAALFLIVGCDLRARERQVKAMRKREQLLLDDLDYACERTVYWRDRFQAQGYREPRFETQAEADRRRAMERHAADAVARVVRLPKQRGGAS